jgi:sigma-B regulation protein RsbU (phosphoserine phosphatase)
MPCLAGYELSGAWQPAHVIGGDYYDALPLSDEHIGLCIADVSGKGVPAALLMSNMQAAVKAVAGRDVSPRALCEHINRIMYRNMNVEKFITFFYGLLDTNNRRLAYTNAGHNLPLLVRHDGSHHWLHGGGTVLGVFEDWVYEEHEITLTPGDRVVLFTDGVTEARNADGEEFGEDRLARVVMDHRTLSADALHQKVLETVNNFGTGEISDDVTLMVLAVASDT